MCALSLFFVFTLFFTPVGYLFFSLFPMNPRTLRLKTTHMHQCHQRSRLLRRWTQKEKIPLTPMVSGFWFIDLLTSHLISREQERKKLGFPLPLFVGTSPLPVGSPLDIIILGFAQSPSMTSLETQALHYESRRYLRSKLYHHSIMELISPHDISNAITP